MAKREWSIPFLIRELAKKVGPDVDPDKWWHNCHAASLEIVRAGVFPGARVARGVCRMVGGQHSWVYLGDSPYSPTAIIDPTLWSYHQTVFSPYVVRAMNNIYVAKGAGDIWQAGKPRTASQMGEKAIFPENYGNLTSGAQLFLEMCGPLGRTGWNDLFHGPMQGWPAGEILEAADKTPQLSPLIPIDVLGMNTDLNPGGLYMKEKP